MLKVSFESVQPVSDNSFLVRHFEVESFEAPYHYHPEIELTLILKGEGKRYVGNDMSAYVAGDLVLIGPNLPHCWKSENVTENVFDSSSIVIQFPIHFLGTDFISKNELTKVSQLLERSKHGIQFINETAIKIRQEIVLLNVCDDPFQRLIRFLNILQSLALSKDYILLNKSGISVYYSAADHKRINDVTAYIVENFKSQILLDQAAEIAKMSTSSFCKYYKQLTRSTFFETVMEYRINYAAQLLVNTDKPVSIVSFESGFGDVSHFFRKFKAKKKVSPLNYRNKFRKELV